MGIYIEDTIITNLTDTISKTYSFEKAVNDNHVIDTLEVIFYLQYSDINDSLPRITREVDKNLIYPVIK